MGETTQATLGEGAAGAAKRVGTLTLYYDRLAKGDVRYRFVVDMASLR